MLVPGMANSNPIQGQNALSIRGPADAPEPSADAPAATSSARAEGLPGLDLLRLLAVAAIAWFHAGGPGSQYLSFRLPAVALITGTVLTRSQRWRPKGVLIPWAFWFAVYAAVTLFRMARGHSPEGFNSISLVLGGPAPHLWYAPFALLAGFLAYRFKKLPLGYVAAAAVVVMMLPLALRLLAVEKFPIPQWGVVLPAIPLGMLFARSDGVPKHVAILATVAFMAIALLAIGPRYAVAIALIWLTIQWKGPRYTDLATFGRGVYWSHPFVQTVLWKLGYATPAIVLIATGCFSFALMKIPLTRKAL